jgi:hypothetical protein
MLAEITPSAIRLIMWISLGEGARRTNAPLRVDSFGGVTALARRRAIGFQAACSLVRVAGGADGLERALRELGPRGSR